MTKAFRVPWPKRSCQQLHYPAMSSPESEAGDDEGPTEELNQLQDVVGPRAPDPVADLRANWRFGSVVQFVRLFSAPLKLRSFSADFLEAALLDPESHRLFLAELLFKLLRPDARQPFAERDADIWEDLLAKRLKSHWPRYFQANPLDGGDLFSIAPKTRVCCGLSRPHAL